MMNTMTLHIPDSMAMQAKAMGIYHEEAVLSAFQKMIDEQQEQQQPTEAQQRFLAWRKQYEQVLAEDSDEWTNEMHDELWNSVRDKNDFGREVVFE